MKSWKNMSENKQTAILFAAIISILAVILIATMLIQKAASSADPTVSLSSVDNIQASDSVPAPEGTPDNDWGCLIPVNEYIILYTENGTMEGFYITGTGVNEDYFDESSIWFIANGAMKQWTGEYESSNTPFDLSKLEKLTDDNRKAVAAETLTDMNETYNQFIVYYEKCKTEKDKEFITERINDLSEQYNAYILASGDYCEDFAETLPKELEKVS